MNERATTNLTNTEPIHQANPSHRGRIIVVIGCLTAMAAATALFVVRARTHDHRWTQVGSASVSQADALGSPEARGLVGNGDVFVGITGTRLITVDTRNNTLTSTQFVNVPGLHFAGGGNDYVEGQTVLTGTGYVAQLKINHRDSHEYSFAAVQSPDGFAWTLLDDATDTTAIATIDGEAVSFGTTQVNTLSAGDSHWTTTPAPWPPSFTPVIAGTLNDTTVVIGDDLEDVVDQSTNAQPSNTALPKHIMWTYKQGAWSHIPAPTSGSILEEPTGLVAADGALFYFSANASFSGLSYTMWSSINARSWTPVPIPESINIRLNYPWPRLRMTVSPNQALLAFAVTTPGEYCDVFCDYTKLVAVQLTRTGANERTARRITDIDIAEIYLIENSSNDAYTLKLNPRTESMTLWQCTTTWPDAFPQQPVGS
jgi:hypothetical protein